MILNCLIVDDEPLALDLLASCVERTPFLALSGRAASAVEALHLLERTEAGGERIDLIFLDIQMPQLSGIELSRILAGRGERLRIVFTTAFEQYALEGFRSDALDYLLKPVSYPEFLKAAVKAQRWFKGPEGEASVQEPEPDGIWVRAEYRQQRVRFADILYVESMRDYVRLHLEDGSAVETQVSLKSMEEQLPARLFVRVHRSFIVNLSHVRTLERGRIVFGKEYIPVSDTYRDEFMRLLSLHSAT